MDNGERERDRERDGNTSKEEEKRTEMMTNHQVGQRMNAHQQRLLKHSRDHFFQMSWLNVSQDAIEAKMCSSYEKNRRIVRRHFSILEKKRVSQFPDRIVREKLGRQVEC